MFVLKLMLVIILRRRQRRRLSEHCEARHAWVQNIFRREHCKRTSIISFKSFGLVTENCASRELINKAVNQDMNTAKVQFASL